MATAASANPTSGAKGPRMSRAVVDLGGDILRDALYHHVKPAVVLNHVVSSPYFKNHPLNAHQMTMLANASTKGDYSEFDITLLYSLLRNLPVTNGTLRPSGGWGRLPIAARNVSLGDDIERIREIRNEMYGHVATTYIPDHVYNQYMADLQAIATRMDTIHGGLLMSPTSRHQTYTQTLTDIQIVCMDPDAEARYTQEIQRMMETDRETRDLISELRGDMSDAVGQIRTNFARVADTDILTCQVQTLTTDVQIMASDVQRKFTSINKRHDTLKTDLARMEHKQSSITTHVQMDVTGVRSRQSILSDRVNRELSTVKGQQRSFQRDLADVRNQQSNFETRVQRDLTTVQRDQASTTRTFLETTVRVGEMAAELEAVRENQRTIIHQRATTKQQSAISDTKITSEDVKTIQNILIKQYRDATRCIPVMPLEEDEGVSLPEIYGSVLVGEDVKAMKKTRRPDERSENKTLDSMKDMFYIENGLAKRIFLKGEAGHGKTVLCLKLIDSWSNLKQLDNFKESRDSVHEKTSDSSDAVHDSAISKSSHRFTDEDKDLQSCLSEFKLVFFVPLRNAKHGTSSIVDLVCDNVSGDENTKQRIKNSLANGNIPCMVILDGLDEWRAPDTCRVQGIPDSDGLVNCVVFCTMRPWRLVNLHLGLDGSCDKVVQIIGLKHDSIETVIRNVLVNFYGMQRNSDVCWNVQQRYLRKAKHPTIEKLMTIPLMLVASCLVWYEEDEIPTKLEQGKVLSSLNYTDVVRYFKTSLILKLVELSITRAENKYRALKLFLDEKRQSPNKVDIPILSDFKHIIDFFEVIKPISVFALQALLSKETYLVFPKNELEREVGQSTVELALKAGILSQNKAPGVSYQQRVSVSFFHKTVQEFVAALSIACGDSDTFTTFCTHCDTVEKVIELSDVIMFVCGLNPAIGWKLSEHCMNIANKDTSFLHYRDGRMLNSKSDHFADIKELKNIQYKWLAEIKENLSYTRNTDFEAAFHMYICDVRLDDCSDQVFADMISEIMSSGNEHIKSVCLCSPKPSVRGIIEYLPLCRNITSLNIENIESTSKEQLAKVLPRMVRLQHVLYRGSLQEYKSDLAVLNSLQVLDTLKCIELLNIYLVKTVTLTNMPQLETVVLQTIHLAGFILPPLCLCSHLKHMELKDVDPTKTVTLTTTNMSQLETVVLQEMRNVNLILPSLCWSSQMKHVKLENIHINDDTSLTATPLTKTRCEQFMCFTHRPNRLSSFIRFFNSDELAEVEIHPKVIYFEQGCIRSTFSWYGNVDDMAQLSVFLQNLIDPKPIRKEETDQNNTCPLFNTQLRTQLEKIELDKLEMAPEMWTEFVNCLLNKRRKVNVELIRTNIDDATLSTIQNCPQFIVTEDILVELKEDKELIPCQPRLLSMKFHTQFNN